MKETIEKIKEHILDYRIRNFHDMPISISADFIYMLGELLLDVAEQQSLLDISLSAVWKTVNEFKTMVLDMSALNQNQWEEQRSINRVIIKAVREIEEGN